MSMTEKSDTKAAEVTAIELVVTWLAQGKLTVAQLLDACHARSHERMLEHVQPHTGGTRDAAEIAREFALAKTRIEDAAMRYARGMAKLQGRFHPADMEVNDAA